MKYKIQKQSLQKLETLQKMDKSIQSCSTTQNKHLIAKYNCDLSFQSQETVFQLSFEDNNLAITDDQISKQKSQEISSNLLDSRQNLNDSSIGCLLSDNKLKIEFPSIAKIYDDLFSEDHSIWKQQSILTNAQRKIYQKNLKTRELKLQIYKKLTKKDTHNQFHLQCIKKSILEVQVKKDIIEPFQITYYRCQCQRASVYKYNIMKHLKQTSHKLAISIDTARQRKYQSKIYNQIGCDLKLGQFSHCWLYKNFQLIFCQGQLHHIQLTDQKNTKFVKKVHKFKDIIFLKKQDEKEINLWFKNKWFELYHILHSMHKGNQNFCHKCLTLEQHICVFALGLNQMVLQNKSRIFDQINNQDFHSILSLLKSIIKRIIDQFNSKNCKNNFTENSDLKSYHQMEEIIYQMLMRFLKKFDYIDIQELMPNFVIP